MATTTGQANHGIKKRARQILVAAALAVGVVAVDVGPASAWIQRSTGCVEWNADQGCVVTQSCSVDSDARRWSCLTWDTRTQTLTGTGGTY